MQLKDTITIGTIYLQCTDSMDSSCFFGFLGTAVCFWFLG